jgi:hypothetical protein
MKSTVTPPATQGPHAEEVPRRGEDVEQDEEHDGQDVGHRRPDLRIGVEQVGPDPMAARIATSPTASGSPCPRTAAT